MGLTGFMSAMKGANNNWGTATGEFGVGYIGPKNLVDNRNHEMMISGTSLKSSIVFNKDDIESVKLIATANEWIKVKLCLKNGFKAILTLNTMEVDKKNGGKKPAMSLLNLEWWLNGVLYE